MIPQQIKSCIVQKELFNHESKILIAISGGIDSVVMAHALKELNYMIEFAHCNFRLRGDESDCDQKFVENLAKEWEIPLHIKQFDTNQISKELKLNTQETARKLRYDWFQEVIKDHSFDVIAIAHNADDQIETVLINYGRGCGISGLHGIPYKNGQIVRPLLNSPRIEIENYAKDNRLNFRMDSSNLEKKYTRNKLRHDVIPILKKTFPNFLQNTIHNTELILKQEQIYFSKVNNFQKFISQNQEETVVNLNPFQEEENGDIILFELLKKYFFSYREIENILNQKTIPSGQKYINHSFIAITHQSKLIIKPNSSTETAAEYWIENSQETEHLPFLLTFEHLSPRHVYNLHSTEANELYIDADKIIFPLCLRHWKSGDRIYPYGLKGSKKVQDVFSDLKMNLFEKQNIWILESDKKIVWIINYRADRRFNVDNTTEQIFKLRVI